eukprot:COSAG04_NODE_21721_length_369_cov_0.525926_1_plen_44_part_01
MPSLCRLPSVARLGWQALALPGRLYKGVLIITCSPNTCVISGVA